MTDDAALAVGAEPATLKAAEHQQSTTPTGLYLYGITRARAWRVGSNEVADSIIRLRYRDIEALARPAQYETPALDEAALHGHQRVLESELRRGTVLPIPFGIVFRGRKQLLRLLQDQYPAFDEGLTFLEGHWELRVHMLAARGKPPDALGDLAMQLYSELRRSVRAAVPFPRDGDRLISAAFLVDRTSWLDFMAQADELGKQHPDVTLDITGPWPAYDFVRITD